ncbi:MAG: DinB family protein [Spirochaetota bacterium]
MDQSRNYLIWLADTEFGGGSFNGPALMETLRALSLDEARSTDTYEGYSAWAVALHVLYFKYKIGAELGAVLPEYRHDENGWPALPESPDAAAWSELLDELEAFHAPTVDAFRNASAEKLEQPMPGWKVPLGTAFAWLVSHDTNHNTQIRNMGLASLKQR